jgi:hypothetical protein
MATEPTLGTRILDEVLEYAGSIREGETTGARLGLERLRALAARADVAERLAKADAEDARAWRAYHDAGGAGGDDATLDTLAAAVDAADEEREEALAAWWAIEGNEVTG